VRRPAFIDAGAFLLTMVAVQGLVPLAQLAAATIVPPETFGALRTAESVYVLALLTASLGMPTLAVTGAARLSSASERAGLLRRLALIVIVAALLSAAGLAFLAPRLVKQPGAIMLLRGLAPVVLIAAMARTSLGFAQGLRRLRPMAIATIIASSVGVITLVALTRAYAGPGWVAGRAIAEVLLLTAALSALRDLLRAPATLPSDVDLAGGRLATAGATLAVSLLARGSVDAAAILTLGYASVGARDIGFFGLGTLLGQGVLLPAAALYAATLPRLVAVRSNRRAALHLWGRMTLAGVGLTAAGAVLLMIAAPFVVLRLGDAYSGAVAPVVALLVAAPLRALTAAGGNVLLAQHRIRLGLVINGLSLVLLAGAVYRAGAMYGVTGAAWAVVAVEALAALAVTLASRMAPGDSSSPEARPEAIEGA
jgi:O-antigen/teichoic acid export membrane protein